MTPFVKQLQQVLATSHQAESNFVLQQPFLSALKYHQLVPLVHESNPKIQLKNWQVHNLQRITKQCAGKRYLTDVLESLTINAQWFKGQSLTKKLYKTPASRYASDLDILLPDKAAVIKVAQKLIDNGWVCLFEQKSNLEEQLENYLKLHKDLPVYHPEYGTAELHYRVTSTIVPVASAFEKWLWNSPSESLSSEELLYLCYHGTSTAYHRFKWLYDVHLYLQNWLPHTSPHELYSMAENLDCERSLLLSWALAAEVFNTPLPTIIKEKIANDRLITVASKRVITNANRCSGRRPTPLYRLERRIFWYLTHKSATSKKAIRQHIFALGLERIKSAFN